MQTIWWTGALVALAFAGTAGGQARKDDPTNAASASPALRYESAFVGYRSWRDDGSGDWKRVNERVREAAAQSGGHAQGSGAPAPPAKPVTPDTAGPQGGRR